MLFGQGTLAALAPLWLAGLSTPSGLAEPAPAAGTVVRPDAGERLLQRSLERALRSAREELVASRDLYTDHSSWDDPWVVESEHYSVRTTHSRYLAAKTTRDLEYMLGQFQFLLGTDHTPRQPYPIWILPSLQDYNALGGSAAEHSSFYGSFLATDQVGIPVATYEIPNQKLLGMWITHSAAHQFVQDAFGRVPPTWISEGLASYFSLFWDWRWGSAKLKELIDQRRYVRISHLTVAPPSSYLNNPEERLVVLGMFFNFLLNHHPETRLTAEGQPASPASFVDYLRDVVRGRNDRQNPFRLLLEQDLDLLEAEFRGHDFDD